MEIYNVNRTLSSSIKNKTTETHFCPNCDPTLRKGEPHKQLALIFTSLSIKDRRNCLMQKANRVGHEIVSVNCSNVQKNITVKCKIHNKEYQFPLKSYCCREKKLDCCLEEKKYLPRDLKLRQKALLEEAHSRGHSFIELDVSSSKNKALVFCHKHQQEHSIGRLDQYYRSESGGVRCCSNEMRKAPPKDDLDNLLQKRGHELIGPRPDSYRGSMEVACIFHACVHKTTYERYKKTKTGLPCCGAAAGAQTRIIHGKDVNRARQEWRSNTNQHKWRKAVREDWFNTCPITKETIPEKQPKGVRANVEAHHLFGGARYDVLTDNRKNGILLSKQIHKSFHDKYRVECTAHDLINFLNERILFWKQFESTRNWAQNATKLIPKLQEIELELESILAEK